MQEIVQDQLRQTIATMNAVADDAALHRTLIETAAKTAASLRAGHKLLVAGNGGSAADAQHIVAEFVGRFVKERAAMRAIALTTDTSILTGIGNDYGYERVFSRQLEALAQPGDVFMAISTSGNSPNILRALEQAHSMQVVTIGLTGQGGGKMASLCDCCLHMPSTVTAKIQEAHLALEHIFCLLTEQMYFSTDGK